MLSLMFGNHGITGTFVAPLLEFDAKEDRGGAIEKRRLKRDRLYLALIGSHELLAYLGSFILDITSLSRHTENPCESFVSLL